MRRMTVGMLMAFGLVASLFLASCGVTNGSGGIYGTGGGAGAGTTPTAAPASGVVATASATVGGKSETILTNGAGMTLYYRTLDSANAASCTDVCTQTWPPLLAGSGTPTSATSLSGTLAVLNDANGAQVTYNGHPLYTYSGDRAPGDTTGNGVEGTWFAATPTLAVLTTQSTPSASPTCTGYGCY